MPLQIRRGTNNDRVGIPFAEGEIVFTTDTKKLFVGDGTTLGGIAVDTSLSLPAQAGHANQFLTTDGTGTLRWETVTSGGGGIASVSADTTPSLGGDLTLSSHDIVGTGNINITGSLSATGLGANLPLGGHTINGSGNINITGTIQASGSIGNSTLSIVNNNINAGTSPLIIKSSDLVSTMIVSGLTNGSISGSSSLEINSVRGTIDSPTTTLPGDYVGRITLAGWNGTSYKPAASMYSAWTADAVLSDTFPESQLVLVAGGGGTRLRTAVFTSSGTFYAPVLQTGVYNGSSNYPTLPSNPVIASGAIIFDSSNSHFYGWTGSTWKQLDN